jgi:hypothetical protein
MQSNKLLQIAKFLVYTLEVHLLEFVNLLEYVGGDFPRISSDSLHHSHSNFFVHLPSDIISLQLPSNPQSCWCII